jgi:hypothetical protein
MAAPPRFRAQLSSISAELTQLLLCGCMGRCPRKGSAYVSQTHVNYCVSLSIAAPALQSKGGFEKTSAELPAHRSGIH